MRVILYVAAGGAFGSVARYAISIWARARFGEGFPSGTLMVNLVGSLVLGLVLGLALGGRLSPATSAAIGTGFLGAFTTFSTFSCDTVKLLESGRVGTALLYIGANVLIGLCAAWSGFAMARRLVS